jgi:CheY-like chemotaxis protein
LLENLAEMLRAALGPAISVAVDAPAVLPALWVDRGQLESVLVNLANNARDAMGSEGRILLRAALAAGDGDALPAGLAAGGCIRLSVVDAGAGMAPEVLARVTEPFFTTKPRGQGTGLGLAMARGFAEQSGGALTIESAQGRGTTVSLWLPLAEAAVAAPAADAPRGAEKRPVARTGAVALLLAEDEPEVREILATELTERGFVVSAAADAAGALALLDGGFRPDAVVTDLAMPGGMDGLGLVEEARRRLPRLPAVLVTGHAGEAASERLAAVERGGPFALVRKPAATEVLIERLDRVLGERRAVPAE